MDSEKNKLRVAMIMKQDDLKKVIMKKNELETEIRQLKKKMQQMEFMLRDKKQQESKINSQEQMLQVEIKKMRKKVMFGK